MKKYTKIVIALLLVICLIVTGTNIYYYNTFLDGCSIVYCDIDDLDSLKEKTQFLTEKTKIFFEEKISLHKELMSHYENMVFLEMTDVIKREEENDNTVLCYVKEYETEDTTINFILIDGLSDKKGEYTFVFQLKWKKGTMGLLPKVSVNNMLWDLDTPSRNSLLCYYENDDCWLEKKLNPTSELNVEYYPSNSFFFDIDTEAKISMIQIWGCIMPTEDYSNNSKLIQIQLNLQSRIINKNKLEYVIEWWDVGSSS